MHNATNLGMNYAIRSGNKIAKEILENDKNKMGK